ncbi:winged helix DNA-binding protein [Sphingopyxis sp. NJF-3]
MTSGPDEPASEAGDIPLLGGNEQDQLAAIAQSEFHNRRRRDSLIRYDLFAEPAWDMLLDLYIQHHRGQPVTIDRLCTAAATASTTALRWLGLLIEKELVIRSSTAEEDGIVRVALSERGIGEMERYLRDFLHRDRLGGDIAAALSTR